MSARTSRLITLTLCSLALSTSAFAHEYTLGALKISHPYARATVPGQPSGAAYLTIENTGKNGDKLMSLNSAVAESAGIHSMSMDGNVMRMREENDLELKPSTTISMKPGNGYHIMLTGLKKPLTAGETFPLTLNFKNAGKIEVQVDVEDSQAPGSHQH